MIEAEFQCERCGCPVRTYRIWNFRTIPPSIDTRDLCARCKRRVRVKAWRTPNEDGGDRPVYYSVPVTEFRKRYSWSEGPGIQMRLSPALVREAQRLGFGVTEVDEGED